MQGVRGRSRHEGLFYALLGGLRTLSPRIWSLLVPSTALLALILGTLANDRIALDTSLGFLGGWVVFLANIGIHEFGHLVGATTFGLRVGRMIVRNNSSSGVRLTAIRSSWLFGGFSATDLSIHRRDRAPASCDAHHSI